MPRVARALGVTPRAAQQNIDRLVEANILREITGRQRNRVYLADEILRIVSDPAEATVNQEPHHGSDDGTAF